MTDRPQSIRSFVIRAGRITPAQQRAFLAWIGVAVGITAGVVTAAWLWLSRYVALPGDRRMIATGLALLCLIMALRCGRLTRLS